MIPVMIIFWTLAVFSSIAWYGLLVLFVGVRAGREIKSLTRALQGDKQSNAGKDA